LGRFFNGVVWFHRKKTTPLIGGGGNNSKQQKKEEVFGVIGFFWSSEGQNFVRGGLSGEEKISSSIEKQAVGLRDAEHRFRLKKILMERGKKGIGGGKTVHAPKRRRSSRTNAAEKTQGTDKFKNLKKGTLEKKR